MNNIFHSQLARELEQFVAYQRTLGYSYRRAVHTLRSFDRYIVAHAPSKQRLPLEDLLRGWLARPSQRKPVSVAMDLATLRQFFRYPE